MQLKLTEILARITERVVAEDRTIAIQQLISDAEERLLQLGNLQACIMLSNLALAHLNEIRVSNSIEPSVDPMLNDETGKGSRDYLLNIRNLQNEYRDRLES